MPTVLVAGFLHETNTFSSTLASWDNFVNGEGFPRMHKNEELFELAEVNIPAGGFLTAVPEHWDLIPTIWCAASPSGPVTSEAFERIANIITDAVHEVRPDAVYIDLHGAMVSETYQDADGELLRRVRAIVGDDVPIAVSLDLHANISDLMIESADAMVAYRTYPHIDMAETGKACADLLTRLLRGQQLQPYVERLDFLIPTISGNTTTGPAEEIYQKLEELPSEDAVLSVAMAFPATDVPDCRPCVFGYAVDHDALKEHVQSIASEIAEREPRFIMEASSANVAVEQASADIDKGIRPIVLADTQDNPGAGGDANTTGLLRELLKQDIPGSALAAIHDSNIVKQAVKAGQGTSAEFVFPGSGIEGDMTLKARFEVEQISSGEIYFDGPMMRGNRLSVGPSVVLRHSNVRVIVNNHKAQIMDRNQFRAAGIIPEDQNILALKSSVHFRADFAPIAGNIIVTLAPGPFPADPKKLPWQNLSPGVRIGPLGPIFGERTESQGTI